MSRKDYKALADAIRKEREAIIRDYSSAPPSDEAQALRAGVLEGVTRTAIALCDAFKLDDPSFNPNMFLVACGVKQA